MSNPSQSEIGWIRLYRKMTEWRWYGVPNMMAVFIHLLLTANHKDGYCYGFEVKRGQVLTSQAKIMERIDIKRGALRECLDKLVASGEIVIVTTNKHSLITICNYDSYQGGEESYNQQTASQQPTNRHQAEPQTIPQTDTPTATNNNNKNKKNGKNEKNEKMEEEGKESLTLQKAKDDFDVFRKAYPGSKRGLGTEFENFRRKHKDWREVLPLLLPAAKAYAEQTRTRGTPKEYIKHLQTWINNRCWETEYQPENNSNNGNIRPYQSNGISSAGKGLMLPNGDEIH